MTMENGSAKLVPPKINPIPINGDFGLTDTTGDTPSVGTTMSQDEGWWGARLFAIQGKHIILVLGAVALLAAFLAGIKVDQSRNDTFYLNNESYIMVGVSQVPGYADVFIPIYKKESTLLKEGYRRMK